MYDEELMKLFLSSSSDCNKIILCCKQSIWFFIALIVSSKSFFSYFLKLKKNHLLKLLNNVIRAKCSFYININKYNLKLLETLSIYVIIMISYGFQ